MLKKIRELFTADTDIATEPSQDKIKLSLAALLVEMARADFDQTTAENAEIGKLLAEYFSMSQTEALELLSEAEVATDDSVSLYDFTRTLHKALEPEERLKVIELLWRLALSDQDLNKYEDYLVRKVADLMYVPASDVIRLKNVVAEG
ncbi:MAG: TerB family tellurite resistance protein [Gammaproteobacteria bacterium]|nr:TerB family tellurite resistance protein [Gammaproteobacteria bacterium]